MKLKIKIGAIALSLLTLASCSVHDPLADWGELGDRTSTTYWELGSSVVTAGNSVSFTGKYYNIDGVAIDHTEVWYSVNKSETAAASTGLTDLSYTKTFAFDGEMRPLLAETKFVHSQELWDGYEYVLNAEFPVSQYLSSVSWAKIDTWDQTTFDKYYPATFQDEFKSEISELMVDSANYAKLRTLITNNYTFTDAQFAAAGFSTPLSLQTWPIPVLDASDVTKWYVTAADGKTQVETTKPDYIYYAWNDDKGSYDIWIEKSYRDKFKTLLANISFPEWIYSSSDGVYNVNFNRSYSLNAWFKVIDVNGVVGSSSEAKEISIN